MIRAVYQVDWTEYERGWGSKPDGYSRFLTKEAAAAMIQKNHEANEAGRKPGQGAPDYYVQASEPFLVEVTEEEYEKLLEKSINAD
jgi:hypothetical protein